MRTVKDIKHYPVLGRLFRYPSVELLQDVGQACIVLADYDPVLLTKMELFKDHVQNNPVTMLEEYYTATFDVQPVSTLDIGYVLFGDEYRRGVFLVNMQREHIQAGNDFKRELPDHLPDILNLLPKIADPDFAEELVCSILIPALAELIKRFRNRENQYKPLMEILLAVMQADYPSSPYEKFHFGTKTKAD